MPTKVSNVEDFNSRVYTEYAILQLWALSERGAEVDLVFIQTFFLFQINENFV